MGWGREELKGRITKEHEESFGSDRYGHFPNYNSSFTGIHMSKHQIVHLKNVEFILCQLDLDTAI